MRRTQEVNDAERSSCVEKVGGQPWLRCRHLRLLLPEAHAEVGTKREEEVGACEMELADTLEHADGDEVYVDESWRMFGSIAVTQRQRLHAHGNGFLVAGNSFTDTGRRHVADDVSGTRRIQCRPMGVPSVTTLFGTERMFPWNFECSGH